MIIQYLQDLTQVKIYNDFDHVKSFVGNIENYHKRTKFFTNEVDEVEIYFEAKTKSIELFQVETFLKFINSVKRNEIENHFVKSFTEYEIDLNRNGKISKTYFDIIEVPIVKNNYDLVLICSKEYTRYLFSKKQISLRIEYKGGQIKTVERKTDTTKENEQ